MTPIEWLNSLFWWPFWLIGIGIALIRLAYPRRDRRRSLAAFGTSLGGLAFSTGLGGTFFIWGPAGVILAYPLVLGISVLVWRTVNPPRWLGAIVVTLVNWWMLWWIGFLLVTGGGGGYGAVT